MKYLKSYNESLSNDDIHLICKKYRIRNYTINDDSSIDVDGDVNLKYQSLYYLPLKFNKVTGHFRCGTNKLISLEGAPKWVGHDFSCSDNELISLQGAPKWVGGNFFCNNNKLFTLEGSPDYVGNYFYCKGNQITNLYGLGRVDFLHCVDNPINKWWQQVDDEEKLETFIDLEIDANDPDWKNQEKIDYIK